MIFAMEMHSKMHNIGANRVGLNYSVSSVVVSFIFTLVRAISKYNLLAQLWWQSPRTTVSPTITRPNFD